MYVTELFLYTSVTCALAHVSYFYYRYTEIATTGGENWCTALAKLVGKSLTSEFAKVLAIMFRRVKADATQQVVEHVLKVLSNMQAGLDISIQPRTAKKQKKHKKAGTDEYDNPKDSTSEYWNANWIAGWYVCLFR